MNIDMNIVNMNMNMDSVIKLIVHQFIKSIQMKAILIDKLLTKPDF